MRKSLLLLNRNLTKRELWLIILLFICLVLCCLYFILAPRIVKLNSLKDHLSAVNNEKSLYEKFYKEHFNYDKILAEYKDLVKKVPMNNDLSKFVVDIEKWVQENDIALISIFPQKTITENITGTDINIIPCEITVCGDFNLLLSFISQLENYSRILQVDELQLTTPIAELAKSKFPWKLTIKVSLYYLPQIS